jgi:hypothetical protein
MGTRERWYKTRKLLVKILKEAKKIFHSGVVNLA